MLLKNERTLLKILRKNPPNYIRDIYTYEYLEDNFYITDPEELYRAVRSLDKREKPFIGIAKQHDVSFGIYLETYGKHYSEYVVWLIFLRIASLASGIIVGVLATLGAELLLGLFQ